MTETSLPTGWWSQVSQFTKSWASLASSHRRRSSQPLASSSTHSPEILVAQSTALLKSDLLSCLTVTPTAPYSDHETSLSFLISQYLTFLATPDLPPSTVSRAIARAHETVQELFDIHTNGYTQCCQQLIHDCRANGVSETTCITYIDATRANYKTSFAEQLSEVKTHYYAAYARALEWSSEKKTPFNSEYTPLLEKYFQYDPFPSARDREWLAEKTMMTVRQIEVWFQNHRRRARLDGQIIEKASADRQSGSLDWLAEQLLPHLPQRRSQSLESDWSTPPPDSHASAVASSSNCILDSTPSPTHAFPASFKQSVSLLDQTFPCRTGLSQLAAPTWDRKPATKRPRYDKCSVDELCDKFFLGARIAGPPQKKSKTQSTEPWYASRSSGPIPAPLPSLLRPHSSSQTAAAPPNAHRRQYPPTPASAPRRKRPTPPPRNTAASSTPSRPRARQSRSPIPRSASNSSLASSGSSASEGEEPATPQGSPVPSCRPFVCDSSDDLFGSPIISGFAHYASDAQSLLPKSSHSWLSNPQLNIVSQ